MCEQTKGSYGQQGQTINRLYEEQKMAAAKREMGPMGGATDLGPLGTLGTLGMPARTFTPWNVENDLQNTEARAVRLRLCWDRLNRETLNPAEQIQLTNDLRGLGYTV